VITLAQLQADYPDWSIMQSDRGHCYATRRLTPDQAKAGLTPTVDAASLPALANKLAEREGR
jgi:hypothetical protein